MCVCARACVCSHLQMFTTRRVFQGKSSSHSWKAMPREDCSMRQIVMHSPKSSCQKMCAILHLKGTAIRSSTVSSRLNKEFGQKSHRLAQKPHLTPVIKKKRRDFARCHRHWILAEWKKMFSDECTMQQLVSLHLHIR